MSKRRKITNDSHEAEGVSTASSTAESCDGEMLQKGDEEMMCCNEKRINLTYPGHDYFFLIFIFSFSKRRLWRQWKNTLRDLFFKNQNNSKSCGSLRSELYTIRSELYTIGLSSGQKRIVF